MTTWTCHICNEVRPDAMIGVHTRNKMIGPVEFQENVRYCLDNDDCTEKAMSHTFTPNMDKENK